MFTLPELPYSFNALEPYIDALTMEIHHDKHHAAYVTKLNEALEKHPELGDRSLDDLLTNTQGLPEDVRTAIRNNGGGHWNHSFFWEQLTGERVDGSQLSKLADAINKYFGDYESFKTEFAKAGMARFGSGWVWLVQKEDGSLEIVTTPNQDNPLMDVAEKKGKPIFGVDVWEHAYYLNYQNRRQEYLDTIWNVVNWNKVEERMN